MPGQDGPVPPRRPIQAWGSGEGTSSGTEPGYEETPISSNMESEGQEALLDNIFELQHQFLIQAASSPDSEQRKMTVARMTRLLARIPRQAIGEEMKELKLGQLAASFVLCCWDPCAEVRQWAAEGLNHVYGLAMELKCQTLTEDTPENRKLLKEWKEEMKYRLVLCSDAAFASTVFKKWLSAEERADFILVAMKALRKDNNSHNIQCAVLMVRAMLRDPVPTLVKISEAVREIHQDLGHISDGEARQLVLHYLGLLQHAHTDEAVDALLGCHPCNGTSTAMWHALTKGLGPTSEVLTRLLSLLLEPSLHPEDQARNAGLNPLAAVSALEGIMDHATLDCRVALSEAYPLLTIVLLSHIVAGLDASRQEVERWETPPAPAPLPLHRHAFNTFKALIRTISTGDEFFLVTEERKAELLLNPATHQEGLAIFARAIVRNEDCTSLLPFLLTTVNIPGDFRQITAMAFLVELLDYHSFGVIMESHIIRQLWNHLKGPKAELRLLALDGMLRLAAHPEKMAKLELALPDLLALLWDPNREVNVKALKVLMHLMKSIAGRRISPIAMEVVKRVIPLFDDASHRVRLAAIRTFNCAFELIEKEKKGTMKDVAVQCLVPLMVHVFDGSHLVAQASWEALKKIDQCLKSCFQRSIHEKEAWRFCARLAKRYWKQGAKDFVEQAFFYLETPQPSMKKAALDLIEILAKKSKKKETFSAVRSVVNVLRREPEPNTTDLTPRITEAMERENLLTACCRRLRFWRR